MTTNQANPTSILEHVDPSTVLGDNAEREIRENIRRFNRDLNLPEHRKRAIKLAKQTIYWIFDEQSGNFGPSKFVGFRNMNFSQYETSFIGEERESSSGGSAAHLAIEKWVGRFEGCELLATALRDWSEARLGHSVLDGIDPSKWQFVRVGSGDSIRVGRGQGFCISPAARIAVEQYAQSMAEDHFLRLGYSVEDVSKTHSYDLHCSKNSDEVHVEVKGTIGIGETVILTRGEVKHARRHCSGMTAATMALVIVRKIQLDEQDGIPIASGGDMQVLQP